MITVFHHDRKTPLEKLPYEVVLDNIRSAYNVGAIMRNCEALGCEHVHFTGITPTPDHEKVKKTSKGAEEIIPYSVWNHPQALYEAKKNHHIYALETTDKSGPLHETDLFFPCLFIFGHEVAGVSPFWLEKAEKIIEITMIGRKNSINVATSSGVTLFKAYEQYKRGTK